MSADAARKSACATSVSERIEKQRAKCDGVGVDSHLCIRFAGSRHRSSLLRRILADIDMHFGSFHNTRVQQRGGS